MPSEQKVTVPCAQNIILENRKRLHISGVEEILHFDDLLLVINTVLGELSVHGAQLHVEALNVESGDLIVTGEIAMLAYAEGRDHSGIWSRIFG